MAGTIHLKTGLTNGVNQNSEKLFIVLILFLGLAAAYLLASGADVSLVTETVTVKELPPALANIKLDFSIFDSVLYKRLKVFGLIPVIPGQTGRSDPFRPF